MLVQCEKCGAPLDVKPNDRLVRCTYCDSTNRVRSMQTLQQMTPVNWQPPPVWTPPPQFPFKAQAPLPVQVVRPPGSRAGLVIGLVAVLGILPAVIIPILTSGVGASLPFVGLEETGRPLVRSLRLPGPTQLLNGSTDDDVDASSIQGTGMCRGHIPRRPQYLLRVTTPTNVRLTANAAFDSVMVVRRGDGTFLCDDDSGGNRNPQIVTRLDPGEHRVWVGEFSSGQGGAFTLEVMSDDATLTPDAPPTLGAFIAEGSTPLSDLRGGETHGSVEIATVADGCAGFVPSAPHITVRTSAPRRLRFVTQDSDGDLVMLVRDATGNFRCDDNSGNGRDPQLDLDLAPGVTAVWVGTRNVGEDHRFVLRVGSPGRRNGTTGPLLDFSAAPTLATVLLDDAPELTTYGGMTDPISAASEMDSRCRGFIASRPELVLTNERPRDVEISTQSGTDTVLVVRNPDGTFTCDDDSGGSSNAQIHARWEPGTRQVFVGSYSEGSRASYRVRVRNRRIR